jgi:hypothetical protein
MELDMHFEEAQKIKENRSAGELSIALTIVNQNHQY